MSPMIKSILLMVAGVVIFLLRKQYSILEGKIYQFFWRSTESYTQPVKTLYKWNAIIFSVLIFGWGLYSFLDLLSKR